MRITLLSDTHGHHHELKLNGGDLLIHAGDITLRGKENEVINFLEWFQDQPYTYKIFIAGNHDWFFEREPEEYIHYLLPKGIIYLNDSGVNIEGINIWGSPIQPTFYNLAFNRERGEIINKHWEMIPKDTDILVTHGPPFTIFDKTIREENVGCEMLLKKVVEIKPKLHVFGHIHEGYGIKEKETLFVNACVLDANYNVFNQPIDLDFITAEICKK